MPFTAIATPREGGDSQRINAYDCDFDRMIELRNSYHLRCPDPDCGATMHVVVGGHRVHFFRHNPSTGAADCAFRGGETPDHLQAKAFIADWVRSRREYDGATIEFERIIYDDDGKKRIADVWVELPDEAIHVHEAQLANQHVADYQGRTEDYYNMGVSEVIWWVRRDQVHGPLRDFLNRQWFYGELEITHELVPA